MAASLVRDPGYQLVVMMCDADVCGLIPTTRLVFECASTSVLSCYDV